MNASLYPRPVGRVSLFACLLIVAGCSAATGLGGRALGALGGADAVDPAFGFVTYGNESASQTMGPTVYWGFADDDQAEIRYDQIVNTTWELRRDGRLVGRYIKEETISETGTGRTEMSYRQQRFDHVQRTRQRAEVTEVTRDDLVDGDYVVNRIIRADAENGGNRTFSASFSVRDGAFVPYTGQPSAPSGPADRHFFPFPQTQ